MARMLGKIPDYRLCTFGCCMKWGPNPKTKHKEKRVNKHKEREQVRKEIREERG